MLRELTEDEVEFDLTIEEMDAHPRGFFASDEPDIDAQQVADIIARLERGDLWAWCSVKVTASWGGYSASDYIGGCSYDGERDFMSDQCYADMKAAALAGLNATLRRKHEELKALEVLRVPG